MLVAFFLATAIAALAWRLRLLTLDGAVAAAMIGTAAVLAGVAWVILLLLFFVASNLLSRWRRAERERRTADFIQKGTQRDAWQVIANGGVFGLAALAAALSGTAAWAAVGAGAIAAAAADTWSTEVGTLSGQPPRLLLAGRRVPAGTSGGMTVIGTAAGLCGALLAAVVATSMDFGGRTIAIAAGGLGGSLMDSLLGAAVQERRWCDACASPTEQRVHRCGARTRHHGGIARLDNDMVNLLSTMTGGLLAWALG
jgi:uncharacterized protein (TIGR00297 family)